MLVALRNNLGPILLYEYHKEVCYLFLKLKIFMYRMVEERRVGEGSLYAQKAVKLLGEFNFSIII